MKNVNITKNIIEILKFSIFSLYRTAYAMRKLEEISGQPKKIQALLKTIENGQRYNVV
jgi:hypothetical protein